MTDSCVIVEAPAKINIFLGVLNERDMRGYHRVDSVMNCVDLCDIVTVQKTPGHPLCVQTIPSTSFPQESNTAYIAAQKFAAMTGNSSEFLISIEKHIPIKSGMGGPSADAAATLYALCKFWDINVKSGKIIQLAQSIGADVPFFLYGGLCYMKGAGDEFAESFSSLGNKPLVILKPREGGVSSIDAYRRFDETCPPIGNFGAMRKALLSNDIKAVLSMISNNLEPVAIDLFPECGRMLKWLRIQKGVLTAHITGSGACAFAFTNSYESANRIVEGALNTEPWWGCVTHTRDVGLCEASF